MKIAYFCSRYPPRFRGGTESLTHLLAKGFLDRGHDVRVVCVESTETGTGAEISGSADPFDGVPVHRLYYNWPAQMFPFRALTVNPAIEAYLAHWLEKERPDCVHVTNCFRITGSSLEAPKKLGLPVVMTLTEFWFFCPIGSSFNVHGRICPGAAHVGTTDCLACFVGLGATLKRLPLGRLIPPRLGAVALMALDRGGVFRHAVPRRFAGCSSALEERKNYLQRLRNSVDIFLTLNDWEKQYYQERGFAAEKMKTITPTVKAVAEPAVFKAPRKGCIRVGFIGAMVRYKGIETLIEGFRRANLGAKAVLELWGDDRSDPDFRAKLVRLIGNLPNVFLHGRFGDNQLDDIFSNLDILAIPSLSLETGPMVLFEAFAHRTPTLSARHGGMPQYVREGENGFLFEPGNADDCARVLRAIAGDDTILDTMHQQTRLPRTMEEFLDDHEAIYRDLAGLCCPKR